MEATPIEPDMGLQEPETVQSPPATIDLSEMPLNIPMMHSLLEKLPEKPSIDDVKSFITEYYIEELSESRSWIIAVLGKPQERKVKRRPTGWKKWLMTVPCRAADMCTNCHGLDNGEEIPVDPDRTQEEDNASETPSTSTRRSKKRSAKSLHPFTCPTCTTRGCSTFEELIQKLNDCLNPRLHAAEIFKKSANNMTVFERCVDIPFGELENRVETRIKALHKVATEFVLDRPVNSSVGMMSSGNVTYLPPASSTSSTDSAISVATIPSPAPNSVDEIFRSLETQLNKVAEICKHPEKNPPKVLQTVRDQWERFAGQYSRAAAIVKRTGHATENPYSSTIESPGGLF